MKNCLVIATAISCAACSNNAPDSKNVTGNSIKDAQATGDGQKDERQCWDYALTDWTYGLLVSHAVIQQHGNAPSALIQHMKANRDFNWAVVAENGGPCTKVNYGSTYTSFEGTTYQFEGGHCRISKEGPDAESGKKVITDLDCE